MAEVCNLIGEIAQNVGNMAIGHQKVKLDIIIKNIFKKKHKCQLNEEVEESRIDDIVLFEGLSNLICGITNAYGPQYFDSYKIFYNDILELAKHKSNSYSCIGIGCIAETFKALGKCSNIYIADCIDLVVDRMNKTDDINLVRNSVFCIGVLFEVSV